MPPWKLGGGEHGRRGDDPIREKSLKCVKWKGNAVSTSALTG